MIVTVTANPSLDRTVSLSAPLVRGSVTRAQSARHEPGGKGVNVSRIAQVAGVATVAILPAHRSDPLLAALDGVGLSYRAIPVDAEVRNNVTITEPDGTTTKINLPGTRLAPSELDALTELVLQTGADATWVALCGSLPPGVPAAWYRDLAEQLASQVARVAVDTSGAPLLAVAQAAHAGHIDLIKPNAEELAEISGTDAAELEATSASGDLRPTLAAAQSVQRRCGCTVLATLGAAGALLVTADGAWSATPPPIVPVSTVGAGDATLAGYLLADLDRVGPGEALRRAVAYGSAAAGLAGTQPPTVADLALGGVTVREVARAPA
ncbi:1-phosphofructokinase family hexose kinase [Williamsia sp. CHRR-6]|uniref:1-phosphofructokinase family hexose kinase n=1 Tax=Williamsia sp. CHRR-6 TaxID=2835871 RepID=UPI001BDAAA6A|nr:1-phosphofructokinase family hexose kinase [Williamsia sp. CHRR-6]MBT0567910.1 1-phosphofructokinase family hexose kinase [Williamsia sp. CHRR-6]